MILPERVVTSQSQNKYPGVKYVNNIKNCLMIPDEKN